MITQFLENLSVLALALSGAKGLSAWQCTNQQKPDPREMAGLNSAGKAPVYTINTIHVLLFFSVKLVMR